MITVYFPDGTYRRVTAVEGSILVKQGKASYKPYEVETVTVAVSEQPIEEAPEFIESLVTEAPEDLDPEPDDNSRW